MGAYPTEGFFDGDQFEDLRYFIMGMRSISAQNKLFRLFQNACVIKEHDKLKDMLFCNIFGQ